MTSLKHPSSPTSMGREQTDRISKKNKKICDMILANRIILLLVGRRYSSSVGSYYACIQIMHACRKARLF